MGTNQAANSAALPPDTSATHCNTRTLEEIDLEYEQIGCLGHGGFGSVFLAKKKSGRRVALKLMLLDGSDDDQHETFTREIDAVAKLNSLNSRDGTDRDLAIIFFEEWFTGPGFACIVMNFADGGTLSEELCSRVEPYAERRIAYYALQLSEALAYAHERGVSHHDVKSSNVLIDATGGGRLLLADFGTSVALGGETVGFTKSYAAPELLTAFERDDYSGFQAEKVDAFGLGCVIYELLALCKLADLTEGQTLAECIQKGPGLDAALNLPCLQLPWLSGNGKDDDGVVGYSQELRSLVKTLLEPEPTNRWTPSALQNPFRHDPLSPLLHHSVVAAQRPVAGAPVTVDNVQLGMFVQRGQDWADGDVDGGPGGIGVVVKLDADAGFTGVAFPSRVPSKKIEAICSRIGAGNKFELQVGPTPMVDFYAGGKEARWTGMLWTSDASKYSVGQQINTNCVVVDVQNDKNMILVAPVTKEQVPTMPPPSISTHGASFAGSREPRSPPSSWQSNAGLFVEVTDAQERNEVIELFRSYDGGQDDQSYEVTSVQRIQSSKFWDSYSVASEAVALENWGMANEQRFFYHTWPTSPDTLVTAYDDFYRGLREQKPKFFDKIELSKKLLHSHKGAFEMKIILLQVTLGRVFDPDKATPHCLKFHSEFKTSKDGKAKVFTCRDPAQVFPEYIITYRQPINGRRIVRCRRPPSATTCPSPRATNINPSGKSSAPDRPRRRIVKCRHPPSITTCPSPRATKINPSGESSPPDRPRRTTVPSDKAGTLATPYQVTPVNDGTWNVSVQAITAMPAYKSKSFEELRMEDYDAGNGCARQPAQIEGPSRGKAAGKVASPSSVVTDISPSGESSAPDRPGRTTVPSDITKWFEELKVKDYGSGNGGHVRRPAQAERPKQGASAAGKVAGKSSSKGSSNAPANA